MRAYQARREGKRAMSVPTAAGRHGGISPGLLKLLSGDQDPPAAPAFKPAAPSGAIGPDTFHRIEKFHHCRIMRLPIGQRGSAIRLYLAPRRDHPGTLSPADLITVKTDYDGLKARYKLAGAACESGFRGLVECGVLARKQKGFCHLLPQEVGEPAGFTRIPRRVARRANDLTPAALCLITLAWGREDGGPPPADASAHDRFVTLPKRLYGTLNMTDGGFRGAIKTLCRLGFIEPLPAAADLFRLAGLPLTPDNGDDAPAEEDVEGAPTQAIRAPIQAIGASPATPSLGLARPSLGLARGDLIEYQENTNQERDQEKLRRRGGPSQQREAGGAQRPAERARAEPKAEAENGEAFLRGQLEKLRLAKSGQAQLQPPQDDGLARQPADDRVPAVVKHQGERQGAPPPPVADDGWGRMNDVAERVRRIEAAAQEAGGDYDRLLDAFRDCDALDGILGGERYAPNRAGAASAAYERFRLANATTHSRLARELRIIEKAEEERDRDEWFAELDDEFAAFEAART